MVILNPNPNGGTLWLSLTLGLPDILGLLVCHACCGPTFNLAGGHLEANTMGNTT